MENEIQSSQHRKGKIACPLVSRTCQPNIEALVDNNNYIFHIHKGKKENTSSTSIVTYL